MPKISPHSYSLKNCSCFQSFSELPKSSVDMILVDPPYGTTDAEWDQRLPMKPMWGGIERVAKPNAAVVIMAAQPYTSLLVCSNLEQFRYCWTWYKPNCNFGFLNCQSRPLSAIEDILVFYREQPTYNPQMTAGEAYSTTRQTWSTLCYKPNRVLTTNNNGTRFPKNFIQLPTSINGRRNETQKPVELMEYLIKTYTNPGDRVLDFTMGSGTTGIAAGKLSRGFVGSEIDRRQFIIARARISQAYKEARRTH